MVVVPFGLMLEGLQQSLRFYFISINSLPTTLSLDSYYIHDEGFYALGQKLCLAVLHCSPPLSISQHAQGLESTASNPRTDKLVSTERYKTSNNRYKLTQ